LLFRVTGGSGQKKVLVFLPKMIITFKIAVVLVHLPPGRESGHDGRFQPGGGSHAVMAGHVAIREKSQGK
jgi:hypothetical protein